MKKYILLSLFVVCTTLAFGQSKIIERKVNNFVEDTKEEFSLDLTEKAKEALITERTTYIKEIADIRKKVKAGELTLQESDLKKSALDKAFDEKFSEIVDKPVLEIKSFTERMKEELDTK